MGGKSKTEKIKCIWGGGGGGGGDKSLSGRLRVLAGNSTLQPLYILFQAQFHPNTWQTNSAIFISPTLFVQHSLCNVCTSEVMLGHDREHQEKRKELQCLCCQQWTTNRSSKITIIEAIAKKKNPHLGQHAYAN